MQEDFRLALRCESPRNIHSRLELLKKADIQQEWIYNEIASAMIEQCAEISTTVPERFWHSINCACENCAPVKEHVLLGGKEEPQKKKPGKKKKEQEAEESPYSAENTFRERLLYLNTFMNDDWNVFREKNIERGDLIFIQPPGFICQSCDYDIWIGPKNPLYSTRRSTFAEIEGETIEEYRRRIAVIPNLHLYMKHFSGKLIGHETGCMNATQLHLLWHMWAENGYLQCQSLSDIAEMNFPLDTWLVNRFIHSWQGN